jgi:hypothetical protein
MAPTARTLRGRRVSGFDLAARVGERRGSGKGRGGGGSYEGEGDDGFETGGHGARVVLGGRMDGRSCGARAMAV